VLPKALNLLRIQGHAKPEGVISVPLKMEHVRERVHVSQAFKDRPKQEGVISAPLQFLSKISASKST
jgi:hypothetical protein